MNSETAPKRAAWPYVVAIVGAFLIIGALAWAIHAYTQPAPLGTDRAAERSKALAELRASETEALEHVGWVEQGKGIVRLPIDLAMQMVESEWGQNPAAGRSNLVAREEKANPPPPPKAPEKPSPFE